jgi:large subunit ribosomal protein L29
MKNKIDEYRGMGEEQLQLSLKDVTKNLFHLRCQSATDRLETPSEVAKAKREIARIKTILRERELAKQLEAASKEKAK